MSDDLSAREISRMARRDRDAKASAKSGMRAGLAKSFVLRGDIERRRYEGQQVGRPPKPKKRA